MGVNIFAFLWGLAEATLFFIVPGALLSLIALQALAGWNLPSSPLYRHIHAH